MRSSSSPSFRGPATHREVLVFLWRHLSRRWLLLSAMIVLLLLSTALGLLQPFFYKVVVDAAAEGAGRVSAPMARHAVLMILFGVLAGCGHILAHEGAAFILGWLETRVMREAHADVFAHVQRLSTHFHIHSFAGATARRIGRGTDAIEGVLDVVWFNFVPLIVGTAGLAVVLAFFAPVIAVAVVLSAVLYVPFSVALDMIVMSLQRRADRQDTRVTASLVDAVAGNATVKAFSAERLEDARHDGVVEEWQRRLLRLWSVGTRMAFVQSSAMLLIEFVLLSLSVWLWYRGEFTAGSFVVIVFYIGRLWGYMRDIGRQVRAYLRNVAHLEEMVGLFLTPPAVQDAPGAPPLTVTEGRVIFDRVTFVYPGRGDDPVFRDFSVMIAPGEKIALVGHSGGGKSTFVKLLQRLYDLDSGRILIDGQDIRAVTQGSLRASVGLVPQDPILFHRSLAENIAYGSTRLTTGGSTRLTTGGKPDATRSEVEAAARKAHAHEFIQRFPKGYDTLVGERGVKLSGGERQRVAIARAILADAPILVLDEATSSLDSLSEKYIQEALGYLMEGRTTIVIAHRLSTIRRVDRILVIEDGRIVEEGSHDALLLKENGVYRRFYELQAGGFIGE